MRLFGIYLSFTLKGKKSASAWFAASWPAGWGRIARSVEFISLVWANGKSAHLRGSVPGGKQGERFARSAEFIFPA